MKVESTNHLRFHILLSLGLLCAGLLSGCGPAVRLFSNTGDKSQGMTYYVGGAGQFGNVGSFDVPNGLRDAGYRGAVEVFTWQIVSPVDQIYESRNRSKGADLASKIRRYQRRYPDNRVNIIALSAGTGIATFALEYLPKEVNVDQVVFLGSSLSSRYDLTRALRRVDGNLYALYSPRDIIHNRIVRYTGTVDRSSASADGIAGLRGFRLPHSMGSDSEKQYAKVYNVPWRVDFSDSGYDGGHTDSTKREFIRRYIGPLILGNDENLIGEGGKYAELPFGGSRESTALPTDDQPNEDTQARR